MGIGSNFDFPLIAMVLAINKHRLRSEIYLILPKWMLEVLSFGLLSPQKLKSRAGLNPGFCPVQVLTVACFYLAQLFQTMESKWMDLYLNSTFVT
jgi:hypothetical protein